MFVSSFSTYINDINHKKTRRDPQKTNLSSSEFSAHLQENQQVLTSKVAVKTPINYISNYKSFANKQKLQDEQLTKKPIERFSKINKMQSAKTSYEVNSKVFSLLRVPHITLNQVQKQEEKLPIKLQQKMVNTYIANDKYYKITA